MLTQKKIRELFNYSNGNLYFKTRVANRVSVGDKVGWIDKRGYVKTEVNYKAYFVHRLIYAYHYGLIKNQIDHINGVKHDNRIENLRDCTPSQNVRNQSINSSNTSGVKGVHYRPHLGKYQARLTIDGKRVSLGHFKNIKDAEECVRRERKAQHGEYCNHG